VDVQLSKPYHPAALRRVVKEAIGRALTRAA
jgi:hypothetical protein